MSVFLGALVLNWLMSPGIYDTYERSTGILFTIILIVIALILSCILLYRYVDLVVRSVGRNDEQA